MHKLMKDNLLYKLIWVKSLILATLLLPACSGEKKPPPKPPVPVVAAPVVQKDVPVQLKTIGNVEAYATVAIKARVGGELREVKFREGQDVVKGQLLFVIDPRPLETALKQAEANLAKDRALANKAENDAKRYTELIRRDFVSREQYDQARATAESLAAIVKADEVAVANAKLQLSYCYINSPISGRTGSLKADQGNLIKADADTSMVVINQIQPIYVSFSLPQQYLPDIKKYLAQGRVGVKALITGEEQRPEDGILTFVNNTVDPATGTFLLKATYENRENRLWPGLFVNVAVHLTTQRQALVVPAQALQTGQQGQFVFVVKEDRTVETRPVEMERIFDGEMVVKKGLTPGELVVTDGQLRLVPGAKVEIKNKP
jgi:multidrug efflux system membrane fusion protein